MSSALAIKDYAATFEHGDHRKRPNSKLNWFANPARHESLRFKRMASLGGEGMAHYGVFICLVGLASRHEASRRGLLIDDQDRPLSPEDMALMIGTTVDAVAAAIDYLCRPEIGWLQPVDVESELAKRTQTAQRPDDDPTAPRQRPDSAPATQQDKTKPHPTPQDNDLGGVGGDDSEKRAPQAVAARLMTQAGISRPKAATLASQGITPHHVLQAQAEVLATPDARSPAALLAHKLAHRAGEPPPTMTINEAHAAIKHFGQDGGITLALDGVEIIPRQFKRNPEGLFLTEPRAAKPDIPANRLADLEIR